MLTINRFVLIHDGKPIEADGSIPYGPTWRQCVDVAVQWCRDLGMAKLPRGDARNYYKNADCRYYVWIENRPTNFPLPGDIAQFQTGPDGHVAVVISADSVGLRVIEQNVPKGTVCRTHLYNYLNPKCLGWLRPIIR